MSSPPTRVQRVRPCTSARAPPPARTRLREAETKVMVDIDTIHPSDVVLVQQGGRVFHATIRGRGVGGFVIEPHDRAVRARRAAASEIIDHWMHADRVDIAPDGQLTLEDLAG